MKKKIIYGILALTLISCQSIPVNTTKPETPVKGSLINKNTKNLIKDDVLSFDVLSWSEVTDCYNGIGHGNPSPDSNGIYYDFEYATPLGYSSYVLLCPDGFSGSQWSNICEKPVNVTCKGDKDPNDNQTDCKNGFNTFSIKALSTDQKLELSYFNNLYVRLLDLQSQTYYNKTDDVFLGETYERAANTILGPNSPDPYSTINQVISLYITKFNNYNQSIPGMFSSIDSLITNNRITSTELIDYSVQLKNMIIDSSSVYLTFKKKADAELKYNQMATQQELLRQSILAKIRSYNKNMSPKQKIETISLQALRMGRAVSALTNKINGDKTVLDYSVRYHTTYEEVAHNHEASGGMSRSPSERKDLILNIVKYDNVISKYRGVIQTSKAQLEQSGFIDSNNQVLETDNEVKGILEKLLKLSADTNTNLDKIKDIKYDTDPDLLGRQLDNDADTIKADYDDIRNSIDKEIIDQAEEDLECADLKLKVDKKEFSPNDDNIDDTVNFTITAPKGKSWTLDIKSSEGNVTKTLSGTGTGELNQIQWNGFNNSNAVSDDDDYKITLNSNGQTKELSLKLHNYNDLTMISYPEENPEGEVEEPIQEDQYASVNSDEDMTFSTTANVEPPKSAFVEYVKAVVRENNVESKANLINEAVDQALKSTAERNALIKAENLTRKTVENSLKSYNPKAKTSYSSYLKSFSKVIGSLFLYQSVKDIFVENQDVDVLTVDTNNIDTYQSECKAIKFKAILQSKGYAPEQKLKGKWKIYYIFKDDLSTYPEPSNESVQNAILVKSVDAETTFKLDKADLSLTWDGMTSVNKRARDGKYMGIFVPNPEKENLILPNSGVRFRMTKAVAFLFNIIDTDKIANQIKTKIVGNSTFSTQSIAGMSGNFIGAKIPMISAGTTQVQNALRKLDISGKKLYGDFVNSSKQYGSELKSGVYPWVSPLVKGLEDVIDPYNMAGVLYAMPNGEAILNEAIKSEGCSKLGPKSIFLKVTKAFIPVAKIDSSINLNPATSHNKEDLFNQIADSNNNFRLTYLNTLRALYNPYASERKVAGPGGEGSDIIFEGVGLDQVKYVEVKCSALGDSLKSSKKGYNESLDQINKSRNKANLTNQLSIGFVQVKNPPSNGAFVLNKLGAELSTAIVPVDKRTLSKNVYFTLVGQRNEIVINSEEINIPPRK